MSQLSVCVLMGGWSAERDISFKSGAQVLQACLALGYDAWSLDVCDATSLNALLKRRPDVCFLALHGPGGEDGYIQAWLDLHQMAYTGSGVCASALAMNKQLTKQLWQSVGLPVLEDVCVRTADAVHMAAQNLSYPLCVKPVFDGSSLGVSRVEQSGDLKAAVDAALLINDQVMIEPWVEGLEFTVGVLGDKVLPVMRIEVDEGFYDFHAKYTRGCHRKTIPSGLGDAKELLIKSQVLQACEVLGVRHFARVDGMVDCHGQWVFLELNTIPGLTSESLVPAAAQAVGMDYHQMIDQLVQMAWQDGPCLSITPGNKTYYKA